MGQRPNASPGTTHCVSLQRTVLFDHSLAPVRMRPLDKPTRGWGVALPQRRRDARAGRGSCFLAYVGPPCTLRDQVCAGDVRRPHSSIRAASRPQPLMQRRVRHTQPSCLRRRDLHSTSRSSAGTSVHLSTHSGICARGTAEAITHRAFRDRARWPGACCCQTVSSRVRRCSPTSLAHMSLSPT